MAKRQHVKAHCNECGGDRNHLLRSKVVRNGTEELNNAFSVTWGDTYLLLECGGCESIKLLHQSWSSEDTEADGTPIINSRYYPPSTFRKHPHWLSELDREWHIAKLMDEIYQAMQNSAPSLAAMGIRAAIESIMIDKVADQGGFKSNLKTFKDAGFISASQYNSLAAALELGHATIHRGHVPDSSHLETALDILEHIMHGLYVLEPQATSKASKLPKRKA